MKRVLCLYRVSTRQQVTAEDDIPVQRRECLAFIESHPDWVFLYEKLEKGVSGYKLSVEKRDVIQEIKEMATQGLFDILLVFMFDRLGRREDETPFLVEWFIQHKIEVWSTREGQTRLENRGDKLINYIRYWQAGGESEKTSVRVKAAQAQMTADGFWRGGTCPFGYRLVHNGRISKKRHPLWDLEVNMEEAEQVRFLFSMFCEKGMGTANLANLMNDLHPSENKIWTAQTIRNMIKNPIYTGRFHMNDIMSAPIEELRLVTDDMFNFAQVVMKKHIQTKYPASRAKERFQLDLPEDKKVTLFGATMLSGIIYCGHCGSRLVGGYCTKQLKSGAYHRPVYRCYTRSIKAKNCTGQYVYSATRIDTIVREALDEYFQNILQNVDSEWREQARIFFAKKMNEKYSSLEAKLSALQEEEQLLKEETIKALRGDSQFERNVLSELLKVNRERIESCIAEMNHCKTEMSAAESQVRYLSEQYKYVKDWAGKLDYVPNDLKKKIVARFIERVVVDQNYRITIYFYLSSDSFHFEGVEKNGNIRIEMTDKPMVKVVE